MSEVAKKKVASPIGFRDVVIAFITKDDADGTTYGAVEALAGAVSLSISESNSEPDVQYGDDGEYDAVYPDPELSGDLALIDLPPAQAAKILGARIDNNGVVLRSGNDKPPYFALGAKSAKADGEDRYFWLYKCRGTIQNEDYATREGANITRQTAKLHLTAIKRKSDGEWKSYVDTDEEKFQTVKDTFFTAPYVPSFD